MTLKKRQQDGGGGTMSRLGRPSRTRVIPMSAPAAPTGRSQRYAVATRRGLSSPTFIERETMEASLGLIRSMLITIETMVPEASPMMDASIQARFIPSLRAYKRTYRDYDRLNALFRQRFQIPASNPSQLYDLYSYYKHAEAFRRETEPNYNLLNFSLYPYGTAPRPNYTSAFYEKYMTFYDLLHPRQTTLFNDPDTREVYPVRASLPTPAPLPGAVSAPVATEIPFEYAVYKNPNPGEKPNAPPCFACDEEAHIEGEWLFTVSYPYKNNQTGEMETKTHYYDYEDITKAPLSHQHRTRHPILMGNHWIDLDEIRDKMRRLQRGSSASSSSASRASRGGGTGISRLRVPSPETFTTIRTSKQTLDDLIRGILDQTIAPGLAAVFAEAERRPFLTTAAAFHAAYPVVRETLEPQFHAALHLPATITLYRLYCLLMHTVYFLKTPPETPNYNLLGYSGRNDDDYITELLAVVRRIQLSVRVYLNQPGRERTAVHGVRRSSTEALIKTHLTPAETAATAAYDLTYDVKLKEPTDTGVVCFPCDRLEDIDGTEVFIVRYKLPGKKDAYKHYYDYAAIQREPMVRSRYMKHPLLTRENVWIDLDAIREKMAELRLRQVSQARKSGGRAKTAKD